MNDICCLEPPNFYYSHIYIYMYPYNYFMLGLDSIKKCFVLLADSFHFVLLSASFFFLLLSFNNLIFNHSLLNFAFSFIFIFCSDFAN